MSVVNERCMYDISLVDSGLSGSPVIAEEEYEGTPDEVADYLESLCACYADMATEIGGTAIAQDDSFPSFSLIEGEITIENETASLDIPDYDDSGVIEADEAEGILSGYTVFTLD